jgi:hypothetical protein
VAIQHLDLVLVVLLQIQLPILVPEDQLVRVNHLLPPLVVQSPIMEALVEQVIQELSGMREVVVVQVAMASHQIQINHHLQEETVVQGNHLLTSQDQDCIHNYQQKLHLT